MSNGHNPCEDCFLECCQKALDIYNDLNHRGQFNELFYTLDFLLFRANNGNGAIGINNRTTQEEISNYVGMQLNTNISVPAWQQTVLQTLKDEGIIATTLKGSPGTFIPCDRDDIKKPIKDLLGRIKREVEHLEDYIDELS